MELLVETLPQRPDGGRVCVSDSSCYTKSETISKLDTQSEKELVDVNERKGEKDYVVDKNEKAKTESEKMITEVTVGKKVSKI